jgi:hypothetical protein
MQEGVEFLSQAKAEIQGAAAHLKAAVSDLEPRPIEVLRGIATVKVVGQPQVDSAHRHAEAMDLLCSQSEANAKRAEELNSELKGEADRIRNDASQIRPSVGSIKAAKPKIIQ